MALRVVPLANGMAGVGMDVPLHPPAAVNVAVVLPKPEHQRPAEPGDERHIRERAADEVVAGVVRPVDPRVKARKHRREFATGSISPARSFRLRSPAEAGEAGARAATRPPADSTAPRAAARRTSAQPVPAAGRRRASSAGAVYDPRRG